MKNRTRWLGWILTLAICMAMLTPGPASALPVNPPKIGLVCLAGPTFNLVATSGTIQTPDGNTVYMWSYADSSGAFQYPGPNLCVTEGQTVTINLTNNLAVPTSIVFPGQEGVVSSGGVDGLMTREANPASTVSYSFVAGSPGTYLYESGTDISMQVEMGLYGSIVVRPAMGAGYAYNDPNTQFDPSHEYMLLTSEVDPDLHHAVEVGGTYDFSALHNRYFFVNGRAFPDTLQDNGSALLPTQPYGSLVRIQPSPNPSSLPSLVRMLNSGTLNHPFHPHGNHLTQIAQDGRELTGFFGGSASTERFGETLASGQTQDYLLRWDDVDNFNPNTNPFPVPQPNYRNLVFKDGNTWYSGSPYLGYKGTLPTGTNSLNICGEYYFPWHSHALNEFANYDEPFGGMATLLRVDPLGGCFNSPAATTVLAGSLGGGSVNNLSANDTLYYKVNSTTTGTRTTDFYGQLSGVPVGAANLKVTYVGNNSLLPVTQNFNTLATTGTSTTLPAGWALAETGTGANTSYAAGNGSSATANTYSFGSTGSSDRAFGGLRGTGATALIPTVGAVFTNTTGSTITSLTISYTGEMWRKGVAGATTADRLDFQYSTTTPATGITTGTWVDVNNLDFNSPVITGASGALNGNSAANRTAISFTITGLSIAPGATYRIRWNDFDRGGSAVADDGLGVDDFSLTPGGPTMATSVAIWNWVTSSWVTLAGPTAVGVMDVAVANGTAVPPAPVAGSWASYIGTGSNTGLVRVRVTAVGGGANFVTNANFLSLVYDAP